MVYKYSPDSSKHSSIKKHRRILVFLSGVLLLAILILAGFAWYLSQEGVIQKQPKTDVKEVSFHPLQTFSSDFFSFEADKSWVFIEKESSETTFVYRSIKNDLVLRDLTIYVNTLPKNTLLTRVLPVESNGESFSIGEVSGHCKDSLLSSSRPTGNNPVNMVLSEVTITCQVDSNAYTVGTGRKNGGYSTVLSGPSGRSNSYFLLYRDLEFTPQFNNFVNIARSFRAL